jgi:hypothetical protein
MKTGWGVWGGGLAVLTSALFFGTNFTLQAQTNFNGRPFPQNFITQNPVFARNPAAGELVSNLLAKPQPELSVPEFSMQPGSAPGTYWTLKGAAAPLPLTSNIAQLPPLSVTSKCNPDSRIS